MLCYAILYYTLLYYTIQYQTILYQTIPYHTTLYQTMSYMLYTIYYILCHALCVMHFILFKSYIRYTIYYTLYYMEYYILYGAVYCRLCRTQHSTPSSLKIQQPPVPRADLRQPAAGVRCRVGLGGLALGHRHEALALPGTSRGSRVGCCPRLGIN